MRSSVLLGLLPLTTGLSPAYYQYVSMLPPANSTAIAEADITGTADITEHYLKTQLINHLDTDSAAYSQRYFSRSTYTSAPTPDYVFLCTGGEGPAFQSSVLSDSVHCTGDMIALAEKLYTEHGKNVLLYALEHRYYGLSYPDHTDLTHLTSFQAASDVSTFVTAMNAAFTTTPKWVTFGGSYPGMMSAYSRLLFPELIHASVSNSAPVQPSLEMASYNDWTAKQLGETSIGGSAACKSMIEDGHAAVAAMLPDESTHAELVKAFNVCPIVGVDDPLAVLRNQQLFAGDGLLYIPAQGNDQSCSGELCNIEKMCAAMTSDETQSPYDALVRVVALQNGGQCISASWEANIKFLQSDASSLGGTKSWLYQTCHEFGFYQTCDEDSDCPYAKGFHPIDQDLEMCKRVFGVEAAKVKQNVADTLARYGGWNFNGTRILSVNGSVDPWSTLAVTTGNAEVKVINECRPAFWVEDASHHFWTHEVLETDNEQVVHGREAVYKQVMDWLEINGEGC